MFKVQRELSVKCLTHASCHLLNRSYLVMHVIDLGERSLEAIHHFFHLCLSLNRLGEGGVISLVDKPNQHRPNYGDHNYL